MSFDLDLPALLSALEEHGIALDADDLPDPDAYEPGDEPEFEYALLNALVEALPERGTSVFLSCEEDSVYEGAYRELAESLLALAGDELDAQVGGETIDGEDGNVEQVLCTIEGAVHEWEFDLDDECLDTALMEHLAEAIDAAGRGRLLRYYDGGEEMLLIYLPRAVADLLTGQLEFVE
ncbi:MAG: hypothetical protein H6981_08265 [Gammaproteobacteria bacterium]|nr:hypothetical protein [Gammaproteobacteria bacterium]MCP5136780.1 hypothetical protein [Gammaproteobacteria bacterium]